MKITPNILSIPPYISTAWKNISAIYSRAGLSGIQLIIVLHNRAQVEIPGLDPKEIGQILEAHAKYMETEETPIKSPLENPLSFSLPLHVDGQTIDSLGPAMQHNPNQANLPDLPPEILEKITVVARAFGLEDTSMLKNPQPNCHCIYCQVVRALKGGSPEPEEEVKEADLHFRNWDIAETSDKLYLVTNPLDQNEQYNVFLGEPLGCTCGHKNCEHIRAVLNT